MPGWNDRNESAEEEHESYRAKLERIEQLCLIDPPIESDLGQELERLVQDVIDYEQTLFPISYDSDVVVQSNSGT